MYYEIINEYVNITTGQSVFKRYGEDFYRLLKHFGKGKCQLKDKHLFTLQTISKTLNLPMDFVISLLKYEGVDEFDEASGTSTDVTGNTEKTIF